LVFAIAFSFVTSGSALISVWSSAEPAVNTTRSPVKPTRRNGKKSPTRTETGRSLSIESGQGRTTGPPKWEFSIQALHSTQAFFSVIDYEHSGYQCFDIAAAATNP
jgi:hypothetical protein